MSISGASSVNIFLADQSNVFLCFHFICLIQLACDFHDGNKWARIYTIVVHTSAELAF